MDGIHCTVYWQDIRLVDGLNVNLVGALDRVRWKVSTISVESFLIDSADGGSIFVVDKHIGSAESHQITILKWWFDLIGDRLTKKR